MDAGAFGKLCSSPVSLQTFEQDAGQTNKSRIRIELRGGIARRGHTDPHITRLDVPIYAARARRFAWCRRFFSLA
jgi:hypothetical protein